MKKQKNQNARTIFGVIAEEEGIGKKVVGALFLTKWVTLQL